MIRIIDNRFSETEVLKQLLNRSQLEFSDINDSVKDILKTVSLKGDTALYGYTECFDNVKLDKLMVSEKEIENAYQKIDSELLDALKKAKQNIEAFHKKQLVASYMTNEKNGIILGQIVRPIERVGIYVPGGTAPYPSTVLMNAIPAKVAGVSEIIMTTPPNKDGKVNDAILAAAKISGVDKIFKVGGAQAIAALSLGTETIPRVYKIVGPGNIYVAIAKKMVYGQVDIDMIAGPSEILIISDENANPKFLAADLLSQAEHDALAASTLITTSMKLAKQVQLEISSQTKTLERESIIKKSIQDFGNIVVVNTLEEAVDIANQIAPEHLELMIDNPFEYLNGIKNAGAIFLGSYTPEPVGDYWAGPNHTLPTSGTARFNSPLGVDDFIKRSSILYYSKSSLEKAKEPIVKIAESEGLTAHANAIKVRFKA